MKVTIDGITLTGVHEDTECKGRTCIIHSPTDHHMRSFPLHWRGDRGIFERICEHGVGHPDPDQFAYWDQVGGDDGRGVHGCDGCCQPPPAWTLPKITLTRKGAGCPIFFLLSPLKVQSPFVQFMNSSRVTSETLLPLVFFQLSL